MRTSLAAAVVVLLGGAIACQTDNSGSETASAPEPEPRLSPGDVADLPDEPRASASSAFWDHWGDGRAEMSSYRGEVSRYGELRRARAVLIYVSEPHDRRRWVKDDEADPPHRVEVLKLNRSIEFQTGVYPYSILISTFSPIADWGRSHRFSPTKISMTAQEWCGQVFHALWPGAGRALSRLHSYFAKEGDRRRTIDLSGDVLYEDALFVQLRELDGQFAGGGDWEGQLVPGLWQRRRAHDATQSAAATIRREETEWEGTPVTRFQVEAGDRTLTVDVERQAPRRILRWSRSDGTYFELESTERLPYWRLNNVGDASERNSFGLPTRHLQMSDQSEGASDGEGDLESEEESDEEPAP